MGLAIKNLPAHERPREKLQKYGVGKLADHELLALLLGSGVEGMNVLQLSKKILRMVAEVGKENVTFADLLKIKGLGQAKASQVLAVLALSKRLTAEAPEVLSAADVWKLCADIRDSKKEHFVAFYLDTQSRLIERQIISIGTLTTSLVHPREVFEPAVVLRAASIIVAHNHPSGVPKPSPEDEEITKRLIQAGKIIGIEITDHLILTKGQYLSFKGQGLLS